MSSAILSLCRGYRYRLERILDKPGGPTVALFGVNPSTADEHANDATIRKDLGFGARLGWSRIIKGNVFAIRATDVREVAKANDPRGPDNAWRIQEIIRDADILVACWGNEDKVPPRLRGDFEIMRKVLRKSGKPVMTWGLTMNGSPKHPLMLGYSTSLVTYESVNPLYGRF